MLHGTDKHVSAAAKAALDRQIQGSRRAGREKNPCRFRVMKKRAELLAQAERLQFRLLRGSIDAAVDARTHMVQIITHPRAHIRRFRERGGSVIQINHWLSPIRVMIHIYIIAPVWMFRNRIGTIRHCRIRLQRLDSVLVFRYTE